MDSATRFDSLAADWEAHCRSVWYSSNLSDCLSHPAYRRLVELGPAAVPRIIARYKTDDLPWAFVLGKKSPGVRMIEDPDRFNPAEVKRRWIEWWEQSRKHDTKRSPTEEIMAPNGDASRRPYRAGSDSRAHTASRRRRRRPVAPRACSLDRCPDHARALGFPPRGPGKEPATSESSSWRSTPSSWAVASIVPAFIGASLRRRDTIGFVRPGWIER